MKKMYLAMSLMLFSGYLMAQTSRSTTSNNNRGRESVTEKTVSENVVITKNDLAGFPVYIYTGNKETDNANYAEAKRNWISEHQSEYTAYLNSLLTGTRGLYDLPGFPKYADTGNPEVDKANYRTAKELWIVNNQDIYLQYKNSLKSKSLTK